MSEMAGGFMRFNGMNCISMSRRKDQLPMDFKEKVIIAPKNLNVIPVVFL